VDAGLTDSVLEKLALEAVARARAEADRRQRVAGAGGDPALPRAGTRASSAAHISPAQSSYPTSEG
jgi:hypothetical protein